jgi:hypothetical protein
MKRYCPMIVMVMALSVSAAHAVSVDVRLVDVDPAKNLYIDHHFVLDSLRTGVNNLKMDLADGNGPIDVQGFCIDLSQDASSNYHTYHLAALEEAPQDGGTQFSPMGVTKADAIRELWGEHFSEATTSALNAAGFQVAIWEIMYENSNKPDQIPNEWDVSAGRFSVINSTVAEVANAWIATIGDESRTLNTTLIALMNDVGVTLYQDYVISLEAGGAVVPEPITLISAVMGLCGLGSYVRRRIIA